MNAEAPWSTDFTYSCFACANGQNMDSHNCYFDRDGDQNCNPLPVLIGAFRPCGTISGVGGNFGEGSSLKFDFDCTSGFTGI